MVQVTVAIGQFMVLLLEAALWAAIVGGGWLLGGLFALGGAFMVGRRLLARRRR